MKNMLVLLYSIGALLPCTYGSAMKKAEMEMSTIVKVILALILFVIIIYLISNTQSAAQETVCNGIAGQFKAYIYKHLPVSAPSSAC